MHRGDPKRHQRQREQVYRLDHVGFKHVACPAGKTHVLVSSDFAASRAACTSAATGVVPCAATKCPDSRKRSAAASPAPSPAAYRSALGARFHPPHARRHRRGDARDRCPPRSRIQRVRLQPTERVSQCSRERKMGSAFSAKNSCSVRATASLPLPRSPTSSTGARSVRRARCGHTAPCIGAEFPNSRPNLPTRRNSSRNSPISCFRSAARGCRLSSRASRSTSIGLIR